MNECRDNEEPKKKTRRHDTQGKTRGAMKFPDRWLKYTPTGRVMDEVRIIAFKTPLKDQFYHNKADKENCRFDIQTFLGLMAEAEADVGLVIDLTYTDRYYCKSEWESSGIEYQKIDCPGHTVDEAEDKVEEFKNVLVEFFDRNADNRKVVGVHCTHGLNRTGYMICRYLIDELRYSAGDAIELFEQCRGHTMERYKKSLEEAELRRMGRLTQPPGSAQPDKVPAAAPNDANEPTNSHANPEQQAPIENPARPAVENGSSEGPSSATMKETERADQNDTAEVVIESEEWSSTTIIREEPEALIAEKPTPTVDAPKSNLETGTSGEMPSA